MTDNPLISVVIPTYNRKERVTRAVKSVLTQTISNLECIVVDDCSTDGTEQAITAISDERIHFYRHDENQGGSAARNTGIRMAEGEYIAFLDSDDEWYPEKLESQVGLLESRPEEWVAAYCGVERNRVNSLARLFGKYFPETTGIEGGEEVIPRVLSMELAVYAGSTLLVRRETVVELGGFDESFPRHQDLEFVVRVLQQGKLGYVEEVLVRAHETGTPSYGTLIEAKDHLFRTFCKEVAMAEDEGVDVRGSHEAELAKATLREGKFRQAASHLLRARPHGSRQAAGIVFAALQGVQCE
jgi:glycosyltransferase involved in cell wall biosynthesis